MNSIKNLHKLNEIIAAADIERLEAGAFQHKKVSNILFKIQAVNDQDIYIQVGQGKTLSENIADEKTLITRTKELFQPFFDSREVHVVAFPYFAPVVDVVTPSWIQKEMHMLDIKLADFVIRTGIDKTNFSAWINGLRPMSQIVKAMIFNVVNQFALKSYIQWLNKDVPYGATHTFMLRKYFDNEILEILLETNVNAARYQSEFIIGKDSYVITLKNNNQ